MKRFSFLFIAMFFATMRESFAQNEIVGKWLNPEKDALMQIYESNGKYVGKLVEGKALYEADKKTPRKDINNPTTAMRSRIMLNQDILTNLQFNNGKWENGQIYDALTGKTYRCIIKYKGSTIELRGYLSSPIFGETRIWTKP